MTDKKKYYIDVECSKCGKSRKKRKDSPESVCRSCFNKEAKGKNSPNWKGYEDISSSYFNAIRNGAAARNKEFNITIEYLWELWCKQQGQCYYYGKSLVLTGCRTKSQGTASVDRLDSSIGYVEGNVVWCHKDINLMKNKLDLEYFIQLCSDVKSHWGLK